MKVDEERGRRAERNHRGERTPDEVEEENEKTREQKGRNVSSKETGMEKRGETRAPSLFHEPCTLVKAGTNIPRSSLPR